MRIQYVGGPTAILEIGGLRLLTDPTFDPPGHYPVGSGLTKTDGPGVAVAEIGAIDAVLLSHDQHPDNLDTSGRELLASAPLVLSTPSAATRIAVQALPNWSEVELGPLTITGVPAKHGPDGTEHLVGEVTGFVLRGDGLPTVYVSGDNASLDVVREIAGRIGEVDVAVLFAGAARTPLIPDADLTLGSRDAAEAARILGAKHVVPLHFEHWAHFSQGRATLAEPFADVNGVQVLAPGEWAVTGSS
ncbi:MBL fold metallo-hydrolase [Nonomuraea endophytica]|uniref:MBL fold metallo-hydrolase n=1 Tax=Nonomuraea endophytica TaxID=714136 RepID=UPI0037CA823B